MGPSAIRYAGLDARLKEIGLESVDLGNVETAVAEATDAGDARARFLPQIRSACERVAETHEPISRQSLGDVTRRAQQALGKPVSRSTVWRILDADAIKPWRFKYWIFPRDTGL